MRIEALDNFVVPGMPAFFVGKEYDILDRTAAQLAKRGLVKRAASQQMVETLAKKNLRTSKKVAK